MLNIEKKRANTANDLILVNLEEYVEPEPGEYIVTLNYKLWGRRVNLWAFFQLENGDKIKLSCFRSRKDESIYSARDEKYNFSLIGNEGCKFKIVVGKTSKQTPAFISAILL